MLNVYYSKELELIYGLCYCVSREYNLDTPDIKETLKNYSEEFYQLYLKYSKPELKEELKKRSFHFSGITDYAYTFREDNSNLSKLILEFEEESNFNNFFNNHKDLYKKIVDKYYEALEKYSNNNNVIDILENFYKRKMNIEINLHTFAAGNNGNYIKDKIVLDITLTPCEENNIMFFKQVVKLIFHESSHPIINPLGFDFSNHNDLSFLLEESKNNGLSFIYNNPSFVLNEYIVRAVEVYLTGLVDVEYKNRLINDYKKSGFPLLEDFIDLISKMSEYNSFEELFENEIKKYIRKIKENNKK